MMLSHDGVVMHHTCVESHVATFVCYEAVHALCPCFLMEPRFQVVILAQSQCHMCISCPRPVEATCSNVRWAMKFVDMFNVIIYSSLQWALAVLSHLTVPLDHGQPDHACAFIHRTHCSYRALTTH